MCAYCCVRALSVRAWYFELLSAEMNFQLRWAWVCYWCEVFFSTQGFRVQDVLREMLLLSIEVATMDFLSNVKVGVGFISQGSGQLGSGPTGTGYG